MRPFPETIDLRRNRCLHQYFLICLFIRHRGYFFFFSRKDRNLFHLVNTIGNIFTRGAHNKPRQQEREIGIFTGGTSVRSKNIFTDISRYPTGKHELNTEYFDSVCFLSVVFIWRWVGKFGMSLDLRSREMSRFSNASRSKYSRQDTHPGIIFHLLYT